MSDINTRAIKGRLAKFAAEKQDTPPGTIFTDEGAPSDGLIAFCDKHRLTFDWVVTGAGPKLRPEATAMEQITFDLLVLHGMLEGLDLLIGDAMQLIAGAPLSHPTKLARNAVTALSYEAAQKCDRIHTCAEAIKEGCKS